MRRLLPAVLLVGLVALPAAGQDSAINARVVKFVAAHKGKRVGGGELHAR